MTTFQDPPPQSRRSARQSERDEAPEITPEVTGFAPTIEPAEQNQEFSAPASTVTDPALQTRSGRRAREAAEQGLHDVPQATGGEPLEYMTQGRDEPLSYQAPEPQVPPAPRAEAQPVAAPEPEVTAPAVAEPTTPQFRVRDFSPEGRATGRRAAPPPLIEPGAPPAGPPSDLEYRTEVGPGSINIPAAEAVTPPLPPFAAYPVAAPDSVEPPVVAEIVEAELVEAAPVEAEIVEAEPVDSFALSTPPPATDSSSFTFAPADLAPADVTEPPQQTLTRREMRQRLAEDAAQSAAQGAPQQQDEPVSQDPALITGAQPPQSSSLLTGSQPPPPLASQALLTGSQPPPPIVLPPAPAPPAYAASLATAPPPARPESDSGSNGTASNGSLGFEALSASGQLAPPSASQRVGATGTTSSNPSSGSVPTFTSPFTASFAPGASSAADTLDDDIEHTGGWSAPVGHWSRQADMDDETQPWENTVTREVGGGNVATTTSALVLPEMPRANPFPSALNATGEILLTGSIDLPRSLSSVGGDSRHFDDSDVDLMYDDKERELSLTDSSPVSAIRAVSTHTSARGVISSANKPRGNRLLTVLLITAAVMAVGVVGLLIAGLVGEFF